MTPKETEVRVGTIEEALAHCKELAYLLLQVGCDCSPGRQCEPHRMLDRIGGKLNYLKKERGNL